MNIPTLVGTIDRRILINYRADKEVVEKFLPSPFRPKLVEGKAIVGICLIRLRHVRPKGIPWKVGVSSENGAHRIAVEWTEAGELKEGVYVPRRDTSSKINSLAGGRIFPGRHFFAEFTVSEHDKQYEVQFQSEDGTSMKIQAEETRQWSSSSVFPSLSSASEFLRRGSVGYSPNKISECFDGLELKTRNWDVTPLRVLQVKSSFFENEEIFPSRSLEFDNALLMKGIDHEWKSRKRLGSKRP